MADSLRESIVVKSDPDTIMDFIADFDAYPRWQDDIEAVEILETDDDGWATQVRYEADAGIMSAWFVLAYTYGENEMRWQLVDSDKLKVSSGAYLLEDLGDGSTQVTYELEAAPKIPVPKRIRDQLTRKLVHSALEGVKREVES
jgi:uncharacterized membrane protein